MTSAVHTMKLLLLFVVAMYATEGSLTETEVTAKWTDFKTKFEKNYADENEENFRKQIFVQNLEKIEAHNKKYERGEVTFKMGVNKFADYTEEEMKPYVHGVIRP